MRRMPSATYIWPGLPQLWTRGRWPGLLVAIGFGALVNLLLLTTLVWVELVDPLHLRLGWLTLCALWTVSAVTTAVLALREPMVEGIPAEVLFRNALGEYLQGSWFEAEAILTTLLRTVPGDVEARLMLATLFRHTERYTQALEQLDRLENLRDAERWSLEINAERRAIELLTNEQEQTDEPTTIPITDARRAA